MILSPLLIFLSTVPLLLMKDAVSIVLYVALSKLVDCTSQINVNFWQQIQTSSNNFKIINASFDYILLSKRFRKPLFYSQVLSCTLVFGDRVILFFWFLSIFYVKWSVNIYLHKKVLSDNLQAIILPHNFEKYVRTINTLNKNSRNK